MPNYSKSKLILVQYPFSDLSASKVRPAIVINAPHPSEDIIIVPITSRLASLLPGEFVLTNWQIAGLNVPSAVKRGIFTIQQKLVRKVLGQLQSDDANQLDFSIRFWLDITAQPEE